MEPVTDIAWTFEGSSYFAQNDGGGLWSLNPNDIDTANETATLRQVLSTTAVTQSNDGLSCPSESIKEDEALPGSAGTANLVYHPNGGTSDPDDVQTAPTANVTLSTQEPTRDGYTFVGWNTNSEGTGDDYSPSDAYVMPGDGETDHLYAQWQVVPATTQPQPQPRRQRLPQQKQLPQRRQRQPRRFQTTQRQRLSQLRPPQQPRQFRPQQQFQRSPQLSAPQRPMTKPQFSCPQQACHCSAATLNCDCNQRIWLTGAHGDAPKSSLTQSAGPNSEPPHNFWVNK